MSRVAQLLTTFFPRGLPGPTNVYPARVGLWLSLAVPRRNPTFPNAQSFDRQELLNAESRSSIELPSLNPAS